MLLGPGRVRADRAGVAEQPRTAVTVADSGFQSAIGPSQPGSCDGCTKVLAIIVSGNSGAQARPAASWLTTSPR